MEDKKDLIIIMPLFNEGKTIHETINKWINVLNKLEINYQIRIFNDGSTDNSANIINSITNENKNIILYNNQHLGFGKTLYNAYKQAKDGEYIFHADSDIEIDPENFKLFWENKDNADLIIGRRNNREQNLFRFIASNLAKKFVAVMFSKSKKIIINDVNIPFRLMKRNTLDKILDTISPNYLYANLFISAYYLKNNLKIKEISVEYNKPKRKSHLDNIIKLSIHEVISLIQLIEYKIKNV